MNSVSLIGNLTKNPEIRTTQSGLSCCQFTVACRRRFKNSQGQYEADFIDCVAWRQTADFIHKYFIKGNRIGVTGSIQTRNYQAQDGTQRYVTEVVVDTAEFVAPKGDSHRPEETDGQDYEAKKYPPQPEQTVIDDSDELPF